MYKERKKVSNLSLSRYFSTFLSYASFVVSPFLSRLFRSTIVDDSSFRDEEKFEGKFRGLIFFLYRVLDSFDLFRAFRSLQKKKKTRSELPRKKGRRRGEKKKEKLETKRHAVTREFKYFFLLLFFHFSSIRFSTDQVFSQIARSRLSSAVFFFFLFILNPFATLSSIFLLATFDTV